MKDRKPVTLGAPAQAAETKRRKSSPSLSRDIQGKIGKQLQAYYGGLIEPTPDRFVELMRQLDRPDDKGEHDKGLHEGLHDKGLADDKGPPE